MVIRRLAIDQVAALAGDRIRIRHLRSETSHLFINGEQQAEVVDSFAAQFFRGKNLRRYDPFGIAGAAAVDEFIVFALLYEWRDGVHVR